jgi:hypothetical protein
MVNAIWVLSILVTLTQRTICESEMWRVKTKSAANWLRFALQLNHYL